MRVTFWGVRGTCPATGAAYDRYGGDTMCIEITAGSTRLILDAGTGLRGLGEQLSARDEPVKAHLLLSHLHLDHIMGLPHFSPLWREDTRLDVWAADDHMTGNAAEKALSMVRPPFFPLDGDELAKGVTVHEFSQGAALTPAPGIVVKTFALSHQGESTGMRIEHGGRSICYVTDHEHGSADVDARVTEAVRGADLLIYDATYTDAEQPAHAGWGHSTWEEGLRLKERAGVALIAFAHHGPRRTDGALDTLAERATALAPNAVFARQGMVLAV
jgi:phosphoribosyl 1,2-cyclic phosphodiesterase